MQRPPLRWGSFFRPNSVAVGIALCAPVAYNEAMEKILIPQVVVETPTYLQSVKKIWTEDVQEEFKEYIGLNPLAGDIIPGLGGIRKVRW